MMFLIRPGSVLAGAELLNPVSTTLQPFRFVSLAQKDRRKLEAIIPLSVYDDIAEPSWMKKLRTASDHRYEPRKWRIRLAAGAVGLITIGLASAIYLRHLQVFK
jgi:UDP:flavonoid glycosyltransferase YjiC (YdhE family)